jgi:hypothetical protein
MHRRTSPAGRKSALLLAALLLLTLALFLPAPPPASALSCGPGCYLTHGTVYYTDSTRTEVFCTRDCNADDCWGQTTPWHGVYNACCCS